MGAKLKLAWVALEAKFPGMKAWLGQTSTAFGCAGGFGAITGVLTGAAKWHTMLPVAASSIWLMAHKEKLQPLTQDHIAQIGQALQAVADRLDK